MLLAGLAFVGAILVMIGAAPGTFMVRRAASEYETVLYYFAQNVGEPSLCDHISWAAYARYSVMFGGGGASYHRSDCYERVAEARYDPSVARVRHDPGLVWIRRDPLLQSVVADPRYKAFLRKINLTE